MKNIDLVFIQTNAFIQGYAKAMEHAATMKVQSKVELTRCFNIKKATEEFKQKLEAKT